MLTIDMNLAIGINSVVKGSDSACASNLHSHCDQKTVTHKCVPVCK